MAGLPLTRRVGTHNAASLRCHCALPLQLCSLLISLLNHAPKPSRFQTLPQSWDRDPSLIIDPETGLVTTTKAYDELRRNFIIANYNSLGAVDNDDGSVSARFLSSSSSVHAH